MTTYINRLTQNLPLADYLGYLRPIVTHTINRFLLCGDPREGVARYDCPHCNHSVAVPFSCKTRLFCPSCHDLKTLLWIEAIQGDLLLPVAHRFWTFSILDRAGGPTQWVGDEVVGARGARKPQASAILLPAQSQTPLAHRLRCGQQPRLVAALRVSCACEYSVCAQ